MENERLTKQQKNYLIRQANWIKANNIQIGDLLLVKPNHWDNKIAGRVFVMKDNMLLDFPRSIFNLPGVMVHKIPLVTEEKIREEMVTVIPYTNLLKVTHFKIMFAISFTSWFEIFPNFEMIPNVEYIFGIEDSRGNIITLNTKPWKL